MKATVVQLICDSLGTVPKMPKCKENINKYVYINDHLITEFALTECIYLYHSHTQDRE